MTDGINIRAAGFRSVAPFGFLCVRGEARERLRPCWATCVISDDGLWLPDSAHENPSWQSGIPPLLEA